MRLVSGLGGQWEPAARFHLRVPRILFGRAQPRYLMGRPKTFVFSWQRLRPSSLMERTWRGTRGEGLGHRVQQEPQKTRVPGEGTPPMGSSDMCSER